MGLHGKDKIWSKIREKASDLLEDAGILLHHATDSIVQKKKREAANELEQCYPEVFGASKGKNRDHSLQKDTSYAILTLAMDAAKREQKKNVVLKTSSERRIATRGSGKRKSTMQATDSPQKSRRLASTDAPTPTPPEHNTKPGALEHVKLIFEMKEPGMRIYSPMTWAEMTGDQNDSPNLEQVHKNLQEDGLRLKENQYSIRSAKDIPVRSNRCLRHLLACCAEEGMKQETWTIILNGKPFPFTLARLTKLTVQDPQTSESAVGKEINATPSESRTIEHPGQDPKNTGLGHNASKTPEPENTTSVTPKRTGSAIVAPRHQTKECKTPAQENLGRGTVTAPIQTRRETTGSPSHSPRIRSQTISSKRSNTVKPGSRTTRVRLRSPSSSNSDSDSTSPPSKRTKRTYQRRTTSSPKVTSDQSLKERDKPTPESPIIGDPKESDKVSTEKDAAEGVSLSTEPLELNLEQKEEDNLFLDQQESILKNLTEEERYVTLEHLSPH